MKTRLVTLIALFCALLFSDEYLLSPRFRTVYIMSMTNSLNEHLASRLTSSRVLWVVLEPASADAVLTDTLDDSFWTWLARSYPGQAGSTPGSNRDAALRGGYPATGSRGGTIFLVDPRKRLVLWSIYSLPKNSSPNELDRTASRVCSQLKIAFGKK